MNGTEMDGFTGSILAVESFRDGHAVLHGPGGCRNYHEFLSAQCVPRPAPGDEYRFSGSYFYGMPRIPCTYIDEDDYINGGDRKLLDCIPAICDTDPDGFFVFVQSPGAALIGDRIADRIAEAGYSDVAMGIDESLISRPFAPSYDHTIRSILEWMHPERRSMRPGTVNILGLPVTSNDWEYALSELQGHLESMGLEVLCAPGAGCTSKDLDRSVEAEFNVIVQKEFCAETSAWYERTYGIPSVGYDGGAPVGFDALLGWAEAVADAAGADPSPVRDSIAAAKRKAYRAIATSLRSKSGGSCSFAVMACGSVLLPLSRWLYSYLSMVPRALVPSEGSCPEHISLLEEFLGSIDSSDALGKGPDTGETYLFADGHDAVLAEKLGYCEKGVDIDRPSMMRVDFLPRPLFGIGGAMYILDEIFRRLRRPRPRARPPPRGMRSADGARCPPGHSRHPPPPP